MFDIPFGIIINKDDGKNNMIREYCRKENIEIIGSIPYSKILHKFIQKEKFYTII